MKKVFVALISAIAIILILVIVCVFVVRGYIGRVYDIRFISFDKEAYIKFDKVSDCEVEQYLGNLNFCPIDNGTFFERYIVQNPSYLYTLKEKMNCLSEEHNEKLYVFMNNNHYFFVQHGDLGVSIYDGLCMFWNAYYSFASNIPYTSDFSAYEETFVPWEDSVGLSSYEDLLVYYSRLSDEMYRVDEENKTLYLSVYNESLGWMESGVKLEVSDTGFKITLMPEFRDMRVSRD